MSKRKRNRACLRRVLSTFLISLIFFQGTLCFIGEIAINRDINEEDNNILSSINNVLIKNGNSTNMVANEYDITEQSITVDGILDEYFWNRVPPDCYYYDDNRDLHFIVTRNDSYLFVGVISVNDGSDTTTDNCSVYFDTDNDAQTSPDAGDKRLTIEGDDSKAYYEGDGSVWQSQSIPTGWDAGESLTGSSRTYEFVMPLSDLNESEQFNQVNTTIGFGVYTYSDDPPPTANIWHLWYPDNYYLGTTPPTQYMNKPDTWADLDYGVDYSGTLFVDFNVTSDNTTSTITIDGNLVESAWFDNANNWTIDPNGICTNLYTMADQTYLYVGWLSCGYDILSASDFCQIYFDTDFDNGSVPDAGDKLLQIADDNTTTYFEGNGATWASQTMPTGWTGSNGVTLGNISWEARFTLSELDENSNFNSQDDTIGFGITVSHVSASISHVISFPDACEYRYELIGYKYHPDSWGNLIWNQTSDTTLPEIDNVSDSPDPQEYGGYVNITADITDNMCVDSVYLNITNPDSSYSNTSMNHGTGDEWYYNTTYSQLGIHTYFIWANDTSGNENTSSTSTFTIQDTTLPEITNVTSIPIGQERDTEGTLFNFTANITDITGIYGAWLNISHPNGTYSNFSMIDGVDNEYYYEWDAGDQNDGYLGQNNYTIWTNDTYNNWNYSTVFSCWLNDTVPPGLEPFGDGIYFNGQGWISTEYVNQSQYVNITSYWDNGYIYGAWINITYPDNSNQNLSLDAIGELTDNLDTWFNTTFTLSGNYSVIIWCNDTIGNYENTGYRWFIVNDTTLPEISNLSDSPDPQEHGEYVNITVDITDNVGVGSVYLNVTNPDSTYSNVSMNQGTGDEWYYNTTYSQLGIYTYFIWANDTSGNENISSTSTFTIQDTTIEGTVTTGGGGTSFEREIDFEYWVRGKIVQFNYTGNLGDETRFRWNFGDGEGADTIDKRVAHRYADYGTYTVTLEVWNEQGKYMMIQKDIDVPYMFINFDDQTATFGPFELFIPIWFFTGIFCIIVGANGWTKYEREAIVVLGIFLTAIGFVFLAIHYGWLDGLII